MSLSPSNVPLDLSDPTRTDHDSDSDPNCSHSLWPSKPDLDNLQPLSTLNRMATFKYTYVRDRKGNYKKVPIPESLQRTVGMPSTMSPESILAEIPRYRSIPPNEDEPPEMSLYANPPPWSILTNNGEIEDSADSESDQDPQRQQQQPSLIPPITSIQESGPSRTPSSRYFLKTADWSEKGKNPAHTVSEPHRRGLHASSSRQPFPYDGESDEHDSLSLPAHTPQKRKASTDENYLAQVAAGSLRHLLPPLERDSQNGYIGSSRPISNMRTSSSRFSAMRLEDELGSADDELEGSEPPPQPPRMPPPGPRIIRRAPPAPPSDGDQDEEEDEFDPEGIRSGPGIGKGPKKKRKAGRFKCPEPWCKETFTRRNDVTRHLKNAAVHRSRDGNTEGDNDKRCKFCNADLSRSDARARHERAGACGKRSFPRKDPKGKRINL